MDNVDINAKEKGILLGASFEPRGDDGMLWEKNGVCYGRQVALQQALRELHEEDGVHLLDTT
jgi:hypothetical protein